MWVIEVFPPYFVAGSVSSWTDDDAHSVGIRSMLSIWSTDSYDMHNARRDGLLLITIAQSSVLLGVP